MNKQHVLSIFALLIILSGCGEQTADNRSETAMDFQTEPSVNRSAVLGSGIETQSEPQQSLVPGDTKIIRSGNIGLKVKDIDDAKSRIDGLLIQSGGYYANENFNDYDHESVYNLTARIPSASFETFIVGIEAAGGTMVHKNISARDVTEEFMDTEMRLDNRKQYLDRYNELLQQAFTVTDIIEIQEKTRRLEEEIESIEGRLKYLSQQVEFSTVYITLTREKDFKYEPIPRDSFFQRLIQSVAGGWYGFVDLFLFMFRIWPLWIILFTVIMLWKKYRKKKNHSRQ